MKAPGGSTIAYPPSTLKGLEAEILPRVRGQLSLTRKVAITFDKPADGGTKLFGAGDCLTVSRTDHTSTGQSVHQDDEGFTVSTGIQLDDEGAFINRLGLLHRHLLGATCLDTKHRESPPPG